MKKDRGYIIFVGVLLVLLIVFLLLQPAGISWNPTYSKRQTAPFADRALFERLEDIFPGEPVEARYVPAYELERELYSDSGSVKPLNYLLIRGVASFDKYDTDALCRMADAGAHIFITGEQIGGKLADTLRIDTEFEMLQIQSAFGPSDSLRLNFENPAFHTEKGYGMRSGENKMYVSVPDSVDDIEILGKNTNGNPVFVRKQMGEGAIYFHSVPLAFTNYYLLPANNSGYIARCLSYLPVAPVYWDEYYKVGRQGASTPIRALLQVPALKTAWILVLTLALLYMLFQGKRRQRIIPVLRPFENSTLQFVGTVARLYYNRGDHTSLAKNKVRFFVERLRNRYHIAIVLTDEECIKAIAARSGVGEAGTRDVFRFSHHLNSAISVTEKELIDYNKRVEEFWRKADASTSQKI